MPRHRRKESRSGIYHVIIRGINREKIFKNPKDKRKIYNCIKDNMKPEIEIYAYCIMPNHLHILLRTDLKVLVTFMSQIEIQFAAYYNLSRDRNGHVFQDRFKSECVENEKYFYNCINYIHKNPVKAKIVNDENDYWYSSLREYSEGKTELLSAKALRMLGNKPEMLEECMQETIVMDVEEEIKIQKEQYFYESLHSFSNRKKTTIQNIADTVKLRQEFIEEQLPKKVISKNYMTNKLKEMRKVDTVKKE